jgi:putative PIN family toxin of toxin-antitoxin system
MVKKIVIDTNWWIAFIVSKKSVGLPAFFFGDIFFCFSKELMIEIRTALQYGNVAKRVNQANLQAFIYFEQNIAKIFTVNNDVTICRDRKDNFLLALARDAKADFLISRDGDLLTLKEFEGTRIVTLPEFIEIINKQA